MSKIVKAVNAMISRQDLISDITEGVDNSKEIFFLFDDKHKWSMIKYDQTESDDQFVLFYYPGNTPYEVLITMTNDEWHSYGPLVRYSTSDIGTREAVQSFQELYGILQENIHGMNGVLDSIIETDDIPF